MSGEGASESAIRAPYLDEPQRITTLAVCLKSSLLSDLGRVFKVSETLNHVLVSSSHEPYVLWSKSSRQRAEDITTIFRTKSYFPMCKEFYAPYFILFIPNYLYLSLIISNYTSAKRMSYLCNAHEERYHHRRV